MTASTTLVRHLLVLLVSFSMLGCSKKSEDPAPTSGPKRSREYDIKIRYTARGLDSQVGPNGASKYDVAPLVQVESRTFEPTIAQPSATEPFVTLGNTKNYVFPITVMLRGIREVNMPVPLGSSVSFVTEVLVDGKVVETLTIDQSTGYVDYNPGDGNKRVKGLTKNIDLGKY